MIPLTHLLVTSWAGSGETAERLEGSQFQIFQKPLLKVGPLNHTGILFDSKYGLWNLPSSRALGRSVQLWLGSTSRGGALPGRAVCLLRSGMVAQVWNGGRGSRGRGGLGYEDPV